MSFPDFPQVPACQSLDNMRIWRDEVEKWTLEHERRYYCIPKWKLDEFIRYVDDPPQWNWSEYNRRKRELYASTEEKKKRVLGK